MCYTWDVIDEVLVLHGRKGVSSPEGYVARGVVSWQELRRQFGVCSACRIWGLVRLDFL